MFNKFEEPQVLFTEEEIKNVINKIAKQINIDYHGKEVILVTILKGSVIFAADLIRKLKIVSTLEFMTVKSYENTESTGNVRVIQDLGIDILGKNVIIIEDIIDTGLTLNKICSLLTSRNPKTLEICSLLDKPSRRRIDIKAKYTGFTIEDKFVVGYGLDIDEYLRQVPYIGFYSS